LNVSFADSSGLFPTNFPKELFDGDPRSLGRVMYSGQSEG